jgi:addiction module HigA family antidote
MAKQNEYYPQSIPHPGATLAEKLEELEMTSKEFALRTGKPEKTITAIIKGKSSITPDMAVMFENVTRIPANYWMNHQRGYDEYLAREKRKAVIENSIDWTKKFPLNDIIQLGWIANVTSVDDKTEEMLAFFGFSNHKSWESYYLRQQLKVAFRISLAHTKEPYAISAWLRRGEIQAMELEANKYSETKFKEALPKIKSIMAAYPKNFFTELQRICLEAGVKVVHTPCIKKAPISGSTRWLNNTPFIQLTGRYKTNDKFWFTFFHEAGHILLHGKKDIFLEDIEYSDSDLLKEKEANDFAANWILTATEEAEVVASLPYSASKIKSFAKKFNTHPACIIGRLQHKKYLPYSIGKEFTLTIEFE